MGRGLVFAGLFAAGALTGCCHGRCGKCEDTVCVPVPDKKTVDKTVYDEKCKVVCPAAGPCETVEQCLFGDGPCGCDKCACGKPREVHTLVKKTEKEEKCVTKCEPVSKCLAPPVNPYAYQPRTDGGLSLPAVLADPGIKVAQPVGR